MTFTFTKDVRRRLGVAAGVLAIGVLLISLGSVGPTRPGTAPARRIEPLRTVATSKKLIALTFDISWGTVMPPKVIAILKKDHVAATFFLSGPWSLRHPQVVKDLLAAGFEVESHGQAHVNFSHLGDAGVTQNVRAANTILTSLGAHPTFIRPPNGDYSQTSLQATADLGYTTVIWGTDSLDWMNPGVGAITSRVLGRAHPGDIVLMHASDTCRQTDIALPAIISGLKKDGYTFVTLKSLLAAAKTAS